MTLAFDAAAAIARSNEKAASNILLHAELRENTEPNWYIVRPWPSCDGIAVAHLAARRFGVYQPGFKYNVWGSDGAPRKAWKSLFPGYVFVRVWDIVNQARRILACPGVGSIVHEADKAFVVPNEFVNQLRELEAEEYAERENVFDLELMRKYRIKAPNRRRKRKKNRFAELKGLDDAARNQLFRKALGLV